MNIEENRFDFAISFAGEDRRNVSILNKLLINSGATVFYDKNFQHEMLGKELVQYLRNIYSNQCRYCIVFISESYKNKMWPGKVEWPSIISASVSKNSEFILPIIIDDIKLDGLPATTGYLDINKYTLNEISNILMKKLGYSEIEIEHKKNELSQFEDFLNEIKIIGWFLQQFSHQDKVYYVAYHIGNSRIDRWQRNYEMGNLMQDYDIVTIDTDFYNNEWELDYYMDLKLTKKGKRFKKFIGALLLKDI